MDVDLDERCGLAGRDRGAFDADALGSFTRRITPQFDRLGYRLSACLAGRDRNRFSGMMIICAKIRPGSRGLELRQFKITDGVDFFKRALDGVVG